MTEDSKRRLEAVIESLHLEYATGKSREELIHLVNKVDIQFNLCYLLADVIDSLMLDIEDEMRNIIDPFDARDKGYFKELRKLVRAARKWANMATRSYYDGYSGDDFTAESDWWKNFILMTEDRTGTDELKTKQVIQWISTMPSQLGLFANIHTKDFGRL